MKKEMVDKQELLKQDLDMGTVHQKQLLSLLIEIQKQKKLILRKKMPKKYKKPQKLQKNKFIN